MKLETQFNLIVGFCLTLLGFTAACLVFSRTSFHDTETIQSQRAHIAALQSNQRSNQTLWMNRENGTFGFPNQSGGIWFFTSNGIPVELGFRSDGVVVWAER